MKPAKWNFEILQGARTSKLFTATLEGAAVDLSDYTLEIIAKINEDDLDADAVIDSSNSSIALVGDGSTGEFNFIMTGTQTAALDFDTAVYDITLTDSNGYPYKWFRGVITLVKEV